MIDVQRATARSYCACIGTCDGCPAKDDRNSWCEIVPDIELATEEQLDYFINKYVFPNGTPTLSTTATHEELTEEQPIEFNEISKPKHYCRDGAMECIEEMILLFGKEVVKNFCLCNIWKYRYRSNDKNGQQDVEKSDQYIKIYQRLCEDE